MIVDYNIIEEYNNIFVFEKPIFVNNTSIAYLSHKRCMRQYFLLKSDHKKVNIKKKKLQYQEYGSNRQIRVLMTIFSSPLNGFCSLIKIKIRIIIIIILHVYHIIITAVFNSVYWPNIIMV